LRDAAGGWDILNTT